MNPHAQLLHDSCSFHHIWQPRDRCLLELAGQQTSDWGHAASEGKKGVQLQDIVRV